MRSKLLLISAVLVTVLLALIAGVHFYDAARPERIAEGVRVAGIDVGGLDGAAARSLLAERFETGLRRSVVVHHGRKTWRLGAREAHVRSNVDALVTDALLRSDAGGPLRRSIRRLSGGTVKADLEPDVHYSNLAVVRLLGRVRKGIERPARDATLTLTAAGPEEQADRRGLRLRRTLLKDAVERSLASPWAHRTFVARTRKVAPKVTRTDLTRLNAVVLIADRASNTLRLYRDLELEKTYGIAAGQPAYPTPPGQFSIVNKAVDPTWSVPTSTWAGSLGGKVIPGGAPDNPLKARWMGITDGVGIHGTSDDGSIGSNASHGCLRMHVADVIDLYPRVPVGAKILIV